MSTRLREFIGDKIECPSFFVSVCVGDLKIIFWKYNVESNDVFLPVDLYCNSSYVASYAVH